MNIGAKIRMYRLQQNLSMNTLAKVANVSQSSISDIESGKRQPTFDILEKIILALGVSISDFFSSDNELKISAPYNRIALMAQERAIPHNLLEEAILFIEKITYSSNKKS